MSVIEEIESGIRKLLPKSVPGVAKGVVVAPRRGWFRVLYYDPITAAQVTFLEPPTIVAIAELREGQPPKVSAPTISIPTVEVAISTSVSIPAMSLPSAPSISVPSVQIPKTPTIDIPIVSIPFLNESFPYYVATVDFLRGWADSLNAATRSLYLLQSRANDVIGAINSGLQKSREAAIAIRDSLFDFRDKVQTALNEYKDKIQTAVNKGLSDAQAKTQEALNDYRAKIETGVNSTMADSRAKTQKALNDFRDATQVSVNEGLSQIIPTLYSMMGLPIGQLMSPINVRNVTTSSFEFYSLSSGLKLHYIAIGKR